MANRGVRFQFMSGAIGESIAKARTALASRPDAGPAPDRPASATVEDGLRCRVEGADGWALVTDMPGAVGGEASAPTPGWLMRAAWASCAATAIAMRAADLGISLTRLEVTAESESDMRGLLGLGNGVRPGPERARMQVEIAADDTDAEQLHELVAWANRHSPVGDALGRAVPIELEIVAAL
jgi:uncharacterized OsmC-like protein